jgi:hypothetical protein
MARRLSYGIAPGVALLLGLATAAGSGCDHRKDDPGDIGEAQIKILSAPGDVKCIRVNAAGTRAVTTSVTVASGQSTDAVVNVTGLPLGLVTFTADAFAVACTSVTATTVPTWVSESVTQFVSAGELAKVTLIMHRPGNASVSVDFPANGTEKLPSASAVVASGATATSQRFRMVYTLGQPTQSQGRFDSAKHTLRGGLSAATGSTP